MEYKATASLVAHSVLFDDVEFPEKRNSRAVGAFDCGTEGTVNGYPVGKDKRGKGKVSKENGYPAREDKDSKGEGCTPHFILCTPRHGEL